MPLIQFRIHPSVGMARFGDSPDWFFLGPEIPRFIQEKFPKVRHRPVPLRHPASTGSPPTPPEGQYRDVPAPEPADPSAPKKPGKIMPQAARFRVFAYVWDNGFKDPRKPVRVVELTPNDAKIEWTVTLANRKTVRKESGGDHTVDVNDPEPKTLVTEPPSPPTECKKSGDYPNLAWLKLESGTGRLLVIGNDGLDRNRQTSSTFKHESTRLYQHDWFDNAADGPIAASVTLKPAFLTRFPGARYFVPGVKNAQSLPSSNEVSAVSAWVVINMPDYVPDMSHFVSLWDLAVAQAYRQVQDDCCRAVDGRHFLATDRICDYAFYDYYTHIHPLLALFNDVQRTSGQARNASPQAERTFAEGIRLRSSLPEAITDSLTDLPISREAAIRLKVASRINSADSTTHFPIAITSDPNNPLAEGVPHEIVTCTDVKELGSSPSMTVSRPADSRAWDPGTVFLIPARFTIRTLKLADAAEKDHDFLKVSVEDAHRIRQPSEVSGDLLDQPFLMALRDGAKVEWVMCTKNDRSTGMLTVERGQAGTERQEWKENDVLFAPGAGHKNFDLAANEKTFAEGPRSRLRLRLYERLRLSRTVYSRKFGVLDKDLTGNRGPTPFPREFGRRYFTKDGLDAVTEGRLIPRSTTVQPPGTFAPGWPDFKRFQSKACQGLDLDTGDSLTERLDDLYWIVSERDMPMLKEYALTQLQYNRFEYWATGKVTSGDKIPKEPLFKNLFEGRDIGAFLAADHAREQYLEELARKLPRYFPAFLDMANMDRILGGSFLPGIEVGLEAGKARNWSLLHGGTQYFPDVRLHPIQGTVPHPPGLLTKDLAIPWFNDFISCDESFWPTSRPQVVYEKNGFAYQWLSESRHAPDEDGLAAYWRKLGFIRRQQDGLVEDEADFPRP